ncbi:hypothetical protein AYO20_11447 [Fonsecaea nubica]|uniref:Uncharacterized protein n=1 Tax=Fonsecaea nubica TaxID=856822 RepID=A0A178BWG5_9EURO|nr:hypothetical protein AYO20_11447 [Fonsecaea nubica]OAL21023.1 hypothetical protein AYO20_11447 [Fonsecaea nubica]
MSHAKTTRSATSLEGLTFQNTTRARVDAVEETTPPDLSPVQRFMAEDSRAQPWHGLSSGLVRHVTPHKRSHVSSTRRKWSILANPSSTDGSVSRVDAVASELLAVSQPPSGQTTGLSRVEHQEKPQIAQDLKYVGQIFAEDRVGKRDGGPTWARESGSLTSKPSAVDRSSVGQ